MRISRYIQITEKRLKTDALSALLVKIKKALPSFNGAHPAYQIAIEDVRRVLEL